MPAESKSELLQDLSHRIRAMEALAVERKLTLKTLTPAAWDELWNEVKTREKAGPEGVQ